MTNFIFRPFYHAERKATLNEKAHGGNVAGYVVKYPYEPFSVCNRFGIRLPQIVATQCENPTSALS